MTYARAHLVDAENGGFYHCISRCVRRGWLCGHDPVSGQSFEHRRRWIEARVLSLAQLFALDLYGYAIMSNHYHVVVQVDPHRVDTWSDEAVVRRWLQLCPIREPKRAEQRRLALLADPGRVSEIRTRLGSLSWFMRFMNEPIARRANREDECTGRFWEGRFKSIALLDEGAVVGCMAYVDLNPVRAKVTTRVETAQYTSIRRRVSRSSASAYPLAELDRLGLTLSGYLALVRWTASVDLGGVDPSAGLTAQTLAQFDRAPADWLARVKAHRLKYRAYGAASALKQYAHRLGQRWLRGQSLVRVSAP